jgi:hypothetical protein
LPIIKIQLFLVGEVADEPSRLRQLQQIRFLNHDERFGAIFQRDALGVNLPRAESALDVAGLAGLDAHGPPTATFSGWNAKAYDVDRLDALK